MMLSSNLNNCPIIDSLRYDRDEGGLLTFEWSVILSSSFVYLVDDY
jgi:hypothetical protein